ncbi:MAG: ATP-binding protein [Synergistaceae bacterium]|nr:ATP-binding protein [Synergistaceae bacterium]MDR1515513.1 ATP-binding protein [Synergistaceae bacterium]
MSVLFYGRISELKKLNEMYGSGRFECAVIYGRRRVGKTTLIKEFIKDKAAIYFAAREAGSVVNLNGFSRDVYSVTAEELAGSAFFSDWEHAFDYIYKISENRRMILAIDEYPFLADGYRPISSILQAHIDSRLAYSKLFLILCGSSMSFMENQVLGYKSPLYGRRTAQFRITPFTFFDSLPFLEGFVKTDRGVLYGVTGGVPEYLNKIDRGKSLRDNIISLFLTPSGHFYEEPANLLKQELREPSVYNGIIGAIAAGASRLNEIATKCGAESNKCAKYMSSLMALGIVKKENPVTERGGKKSVYLLGDQMFRFWYRFVFPNLSAIEAGLGEGVYDHEVEPRLSAYMGPIFEEICKQYLFLRARKNALPFFIGKLGRWWGNNPRKKRQEEIDIMAFRDDNAIFGECKWTNAPVGMDALVDLKEQSAMFDYKNTWFCLFAKSGFTENLTAEAEKSENVLLIRFEDMLPS